MKCMVTEKRVAILLKFRKNRDKGKGIRILGLRNKYEYYFGSYIYL